jgi:DNA-binding transcriptional LysR family regulator
VVLCNEQNFGRAANALAINRPALSQAVQRLERRFGVSVVQRQQSGFQEVTRLGMQIPAWGRQPDQPSF